MANYFWKKKGTHKVDMSPARHHSRQAKMKMKGKKVKKAKKLTKAASLPLKVTPVKDLSNDQLRAKAMKMLSKGGY